MSTPDRTAPVATVAITLAGLLVWRAIALLVDVDAAVDEFRLVATFAPSTARAIVVGVAIVGLGAAALLIAPRTRRLGGATAAVGLLLLAVHLTVVWIRGDPVQCLCTTSTRPRGSVAHLASIVLIVACGALAGLVAHASRRPRGVTAAGPSND